MKHVHGIEVRLLNISGSPTVEGIPNRRIESSFYRFHGRAGSRNICLQPGQKFKVEAIIHDKFKFYAAGGVKVVVVANGIYTGDARAKVQQRHGMWWIDAEDNDDGYERVRRAREYTIEGFTVWNRRRASHEEYMSFLAPEVNADNKTPTTNWIEEEHYCANEGCIAVFVERGNIVDEDEEAGISLGNRSAMRSPVPIRYDEFVYLRSNNAEPYVFEFRNTTIVPPASLSNHNAFGADSNLATSDEDEIVYDTDYESKAESEDEAEATDESDSESPSDSEPESEIEVDSDTDSHMSEESEEVLIRRNGRKRKARSPVNRPRKRTKTNAQKNAEADAGNASFASNARKNAEADTTNASYSARCNDLDRDDEEVEILWLKQEPTIKLEHKESVGFGSIPQRKSMVKVEAQGRRGACAGRARLQEEEIVDLTLDDSDDENDEYDNGTGIRVVQKRFGSMSTGSKFQSAKRSVVR